MNAPVYLLGGYQTDFARNLTREAKGIGDLLREGVDGGLDATRLDAREVEVCHVGNFVGELFAGQGHLGGLVASLRREFHGLPTSRTEAACASGGAAILAAMADLQSGRYGLAVVLGVELMRNVPGDVAAKHLGCAALAGVETEGVRYVWPSLFARLADHYAERRGLERWQLVEVAKKNFSNAKKNPRAQTRGWVLTEAHFADDPEKNPAVEGALRRHDCSQITDGAAVVFLANEERAVRWAKARGVSLGEVPRVLGWGHRTAPMTLDEKLSLSLEAPGPWVMPHLRGAFEDAWRRAGIRGIDDIDAVELHDCFSITEHVTVEHLGLGSRPDEAIERSRMGGRTPVNPSGGLMGGGHPIGASGVRMALDAHRQLTGTAGDYQVPGARRVQTVNLGGSATTVVSMVIGR